MLKRPAETHDECYHVDGGSSSSGDDHDDYDDDDVQLFSLWVSTRHATLAPTMMKTPLLPWFGMCGAQSKVRLVK